MDWENKDQDNCCIEIKDSIVVIICGEVDVDRLKETLNTVAEVKGNTVFTTKE
ncbi:MAG: hypothetical protein ACYDEQ_00110 [Desulfocucumaceae bacterium]